MNRHLFLDDELAERAALLVLGMLSEEEARSWRLHALVCSVCQREIEALQRLSGELARLAPSVPAPLGAWSKILACIRAPDPDDGAPRTHTTSRSETKSDATPPIQVWKRWGDRSDSHGEARGASIDPNFTLVAQTEGAFEQTGIAGIEVRRLFVDSAADRATMLVRMAPGSSYPAHRHGGPEECFVLQGDLQVGRDTRMRAGDYQRADEGSEHPVQSTEQGCLLLIVSSLHDELTS